MVSFAEARASASGPPDPTRPTVTDRAAVALIAACGVRRVDPLTVFRDGERGGMSRVLAAAACVQFLGWDKRFAARVFQINRKRLTPSGLRIAKVSAPDIEVVVEAIAALVQTPPKPLNARIVRMARQQVDRGADVVEVANCFDVDPSALATALGVAA